MQTYLPFEAQLNRNPEFKRNVWIELSPGRLIAMPAIILAVLAAVSAASQSSVDQSTPIKTTSMAIYYVLVFLWGTKLAVDSIIDEVNAKTWIQQQMSPLSAWKMALGKLFGAIIYAWYGGVISLVIYTFAALGNGDGWSAFHSLFTMLFSGMTAHAVAMILALISLRKSRNNKKIKSTAIYIIALVTIGYFSRIGSIVGSTLLKTSYWYGIAMPFTLMDAFSVLLCCFWAVIALQRNMRTELQFENGMKTWYWFLGTFTFYIAGFASQMGHINDSLKNSGIYNNSLTNHSVDDSSVLLLMGYYAFLFLGGLAFLLAFIEPKDAVNFRRLRMSYHQQNWKKFNVYLPLWVPTLVAAGVAAIVTVIIGFASGDSKAFSITDIPPLYPLTIFVFLARDVALIMWLNAIGRGKSPDTSAFVYLVVLHIIFPMMFSLGSLADPGANRMLALFLPMPTGGSYLSLALGTVQAAIICGLCVRSWQSRNEALEARFAVAGT